MPHDFPGRVAGDFGESAIDPKNHTVGVGDHHGLLRVEGGGSNAQFGGSFLHQIFKVAAVLLQFSVGLLALGDVAGDRQMHGFAPIMQ